MTDDALLLRLPHGYRIDTVLGRVGPALRDELVGMWVGEGVLAPPQALARVDEVVVVARGPEGEIAGVNTAYVDRPANLPVAYWFYRTFVRPSHRSAWGVPGAMFAQAISALREHPHADRPRGIVAIVENVRLMRESAHEEIARLGLHRLGRDPAGRDVWCLNFDGSTPVAPPGLLGPP